MDVHTILPAGDGFYAKGQHDNQDRPHACNDGWVTIGQIVVDPETGEESEGTEPRSATEGPQEAAQPRSWWQRMFGR
jgi:hypothetical protein